MSKEISIVKLMDGSTVVGKIEYGTDCIEIEHPIELVSNVAPVGAQLGESISLRPWMAISEETIFVVERMQIITIGLLDKNFEGGYERMVETIYNQPTQWSGDLLQGDEEFDIDTLTELADAVIKKQIH
jgi:hypothetical protein|tara:strand:+ start:42 stop:428 length:387 start_codon:yes stop_codon:yes gene_type:complete